MVLKERGPINKKMLNTVDNDDGLPIFLQQATQCLTKGISENAYNKHDYHEMVQRCKYLTSDQQKILFSACSKTTKIYFPVNLVSFLDLPSIYI
jgi:hypothetical protein